MKIIYGIIAVLALGIVVWMLVGASSGLGFSAA